MTPSPAPKPRIAIAQLQMHWTIEANMASIVAALELASGRGASICSFPELALTGFHREIVSLAKPQLVAPEVRRLQQTCARLGIAAAVGAPTFGDDGARFNSHLFIDQGGQLVRLGDPKLWMGLHMQATVAMHEPYHWSLDTEKQLQAAAPPRRLCSGQLKL